MAEDKVCAPGAAGETKNEDSVKAIYKGLYKAARLTVLGKERFFVIQDNHEIWELASETSLTMSDEIMAQTPTWDKALMVAYVFNYSILAKKQITREKPEENPDARP